MTPLAQQIEVIEFLLEEGHGNGQMLRDVRSTLQLLQRHEDAVRATIRKCIEDERRMAAMAQLASDLGASEPEIVNG